MPHPALGLPPSDATAGHPAAAARLRAVRSSLATRALAAATRLDAGLLERHDAVAMRTFLRDYDRHVEQLCRALETGEARYVVMYGEWLVPTYRRRGVRMNDVVTLLRGLEDAAVAELPAADAGAIRPLIEAWVERMRRHRRLPGDHRGNRLVRLVWKGAGLGDDTVV